jgi:hypothetical protein
MRRVVNVVVVVVVVVLSKNISILAYGEAFFEAQQVQRGKKTAISDQ